MPDTIDALVRLRRRRTTPTKPAVIDPTARINYGELDSTTRDLAAAFVARGCRQGHPGRADHAQRRRVGSDRAGADPHRRGAGAAEHAAAPRELVAQLRVASVQHLITVEEFRGHRYLDELAPSWTIADLGDGPCSTRRCPRCAGSGRPRRCPTPTQVTARRRGRAMAAAVTPSDPLVVMFTSGSSGMPKGVVHSHGNALGAVRSAWAALHRRRHPALPADAVLLGRRLRRRRAVRPAGRRHAGHRTHTATRVHAAAARTRTGHAVPRLARSGRSPCPTARFGRCRPVVAAAGKPRGAAAARTARPPRRAGQAVRHDRVVRAVLRLPRRHRHARIRVGQLRQAVCGHGGPHRRRRRRNARRRRAHRDDPDPRVRTPCAASAGAAARTCSPPTASTPPATSATSTTTDSCSTTGWKR